ncbi:MAG TPA: peptide ABC transporter substrate-binding protein [Ktedonobacterales bacterium]|nr:peptide ABC transporter substrate-binding protein [Ktedonobacterales bacterium]
MLVHSQDDFSAKPEHCWPGRCNIRSSLRGWRRQGRALLLLCLLSVLLMISACGQNVPPQPQKKVLIWPNVGITDLAQLDPALVGDPNSTLAAQLVFGGLVKLNAQLQVVPDAAYSWQVSPDGKTYTFYLSSSLRFADGTPVTTQDVIYSLDRSLQMSAQAVQDGGRGGLFYLGHIVGAADVASGKANTASGLTAVDPQTLQIQLDSPIAYFLNDLTEPAAFIVPGQQIQKYGKNWTEHAFGTGPFVLGRWTHSVRMTFTPNPNYYGEKPVIDELDMPFVQNQHAALLSYNAGQYDLTWNLSGPDYPGASTQKNFHQTVLLATDALVPNTTKEPFNHLEVRQAFALALNVSVLAHEVMGDTVVAASTLMPPGMPHNASSKVQGLGFDAQRARQLLQSVYPDVSTMPPVTLTYATDALPQAEAQAMQQMWQSALGIRVNLSPIDPSTYQREWQNGQIQLGVVNWTANLSDPWSLLSLYLTSNGPDDLGSWKNEQFDQLVSQADVLFNDPVQRAALYQQAEQLAITDGAWIPLDHPKFTAFLAPYVHGLAVTPLGLLAPNWAKVTVSKH